MLDLYESVYWKKPWQIEKKDHVLLIFEIKKDKNLEKHNKGNKAADIDHDEINEEKEREGYYPNELD